MNVERALIGGVGSAAHALEQVFAHLGDLMKDVAQRYGVSEAALRAANPELGERIPVGQPMRLPNEASSGGLVDANLSGGARTSSTSSHAPIRRPTTLDTYTVRAGDTMAGIAKAHHLSLSALVAANPQIRNPSRIAPKQVLHLPANVVTRGHAPSSSTNHGPTRAPEGMGRVGDARDKQHLPSTGGAMHRLGSLSEKYETGGRGAGTVSSGAGDPGGVSYGSYQLASKTGTLQEFLANDGAKWAPELKGMNPTVPGDDFGKHWKAIAARSPEEFAHAQHAFIARTHYQPVIDGVLKSTGLDVSERSHAVQDAVWSTSVQHGKAETIVTSAARSVKLDRSDPGYDRALVNAIYDQRLNYIDGLSKLPAATKNSLHKRYENERADALTMLSNP